MVIGRTVRKACFEKVRIELDIDKNKICCLISGLEFSRQKDKPVLGPTRGTSLVGLRNRRQGWCHTYNGWREQPIRSEKPVWGQHTQPWGGHAK